MRRKRGGMRERRREGQKEGRGEGRSGMGGMKDGLPFQGQVTIENGAH